MMVINNKKNQKYKKILVNLMLKIKDAQLENQFKELNKYYLNKIQENEIFLRRQNIQKKEFEKEMMEKILFLIENYYKIKDHEKIRIIFERIIEKLMADLGIQVIENKKGDAYVPEKHEIVYVEKIEDEKKHNTIKESISKGYYYKGEIFKYQKVVIYNYDKH